MWTCSPLRFHMHRPHPRINPLPGRAGAIDLPQPGTRKRHCRAGAVTPCPVSAASQVWAMGEGPLQRNAGRDRGTPCRVGIDQAGRVRQAIGGHLNPGRQRSSDRDRAAKSTFGIPAAGKSSNDPQRIWQEGESSRSAVAILASGRCVGVTSNQDCRTPERTQDGFSGLE